MKRFSSCLLSLVMAVGLWVGAVAADTTYSAAINDVITAVEAYNKTHGGTGELFIEVTGDIDVTITGEVTGVTKGIDLYVENMSGDNWVVISWEATIHGNTAGVPLIKANAISVSNGADIHSNGCAVLSEKDLAVFDSTIVGDIRVSRFARFLMYDANVTGNLYGNVNANDSIIHADKIVGGDYLCAYGSSEVYIDDIKPLKKTYVVIEESVKTNFADRLCGYASLKTYGEIGADDYKAVFSIIGNVRVPAYTFGVFILYDDYKLVIPKGATISFLGDLHLSNGEIQIDGRIRVWGRIFGWGLAEVYGKNTIGLQFQYFLSRIKSILPNSIWEWLLYRDLP